MTIINNNELNKKIMEVITKDITQVNHRMDDMQLVIEQLCERIKCLEIKQMGKTDFDEFEHADMQNDEKKLEEMEQDDTEQCAYCKGKFCIEDLDRLDNMWLCKECENRVEVDK